MRLFVRLELIFSTTVPLEGCVIQFFAAWRRIALIAIWNSSSLFAVEGRVGLGNFGRWRGWLHWLDVYDAISIDACKVRPVRRLVRGS